MCTSIAYHGESFCFGRNMDLEYSFGERVIGCGRRFPFTFRYADEMNDHRAFLGVGTVIDGYPMYADAMNEDGLCVAGLNFPNYAHFPRESTSRLKLAPYELIPYLLGKCESVDDVRGVLSDAGIVDIPFSDDVPNATLHWHIADRSSSVTLESTKQGLKIYDNTVNVLTNSPSFDFQLEHFLAYSNLSSTSDGERHSLGYGAIGLPGDLSSMSRFVRAAFLLGCSPEKLSGERACDQLLSLLYAVAMTDGAVIDKDGKPHRTTYTSCMLGDFGKIIIKRAGFVTPLSFSFDDFNIEGRQAFIRNFDKTVN